MATQFVEFAGLSANALNALLLPKTDVSAFKSFGLQLSGAWNATLQVQVSNDGVNWLNATVLSVNTPTGGASNISSTGIYFGPVAYRYMQIKVTAYTSGTVQGVLELYILPPPATSVLLAAGIASIGSVTLNAANTTFIPAGTAGNTVVSNSAATFYGVFASSTGAGAGQIFDNAATPTGTPVGAAPTAIGFEAGVPAVGIACVNGITVQGSATNPALTIFWR